MEGFIKDRFNNCDDTVVYELPVFQSETDADKHQYTLSRHEQILRKLYQLPPIIDA